jgi:hypothetical protein
LKFLEVNGNGKGTGDRGKGYGVCFKMEKLGHWREKEKMNE